MMMFVPTRVSLRIVSAVATLGVAATGLSAAELSVTDGLVAQYDAGLGTHTNRSLKDNAAAIEAGVGDNVREWFDQASLAGNNIVQQNNIAVTPTVELAGAAEGLNATRRVLRFSGGQNLLALDGAQDGGDPFGATLDGTSLTWFIVSRKSAGSNAQRTLGAQVGSKGNQWGSYYQTDGDLVGHARDGSGSMEASRVDASGAGLASDQFVIHTTRWDGANGIQSFGTDPQGRHVIGPVTATSGYDAGEFNRYRIGAASDAGAALQGDIAEVLIYNQVLTGRDRAQVEQYLYDKHFRTASDDVVAHYEFRDQVPGSTGAVGSSITDLSGNGHTGTIAGGAMNYVSGDTAGHGDSTALRFADTNNDRVRIDASSDFAFDADTESFTVEAVFKLDTTNVGSFDGPALVANQGSGGEWWVRVWGGHTVQFGMAGSDGGSAFSKTTDGTIDDGAWHHVAGVYDALNDEMRVYVDFELFDTVAANIAGTIGRADRDLLIAEFNNLASSRAFGGDVDMVRISRGALAPAQFQTSALIIPAPATLAGLSLLLPMALRRRCA